MQQLPANWKRPFFIFWSAQASSQIGSGLASFALVWWLTQTTGSATVLSLATLVNMLPNVLVGPLAGALVDRFSRKWVMIAADALSALMAVLLVVLFWTGRIEVWHIFLANGLRAIAGTFQYPAMQSSTSLMAPEDQLARVAGLNQALQGVLMVATPPLGALALSLLPIHAIMGIDVVTAALAIGLLFIVRIPRPAANPAQSGSTVLQDMRAGLRFVRGWPALIGVMCIAALINLVVVPAFSLMPLLVTGHFNGGAPQLAWMDAGFGIGFIAGGVLLGVWGGFKRRVWTSVLGLVGLALGTLLIGVAPAGTLALGLAGMAVVGTAMPLANGPLMAVLQAIVPPEMQGRVLTVLMSISGAMAPIGLAISGPLADRFGVQIWYVVAGVVCLALVTTMTLSPAMMRMEEDGRKMMAAEVG